MYLGGCIGGTKKIMLGHVVSIDLLAIQPMGRCIKSLEYYWSCWFRIILNHFALESRCLNRIRLP